MGLFESLPPDVVREIVRHVAVTLQQESGLDGAIEHISAKLRTLRLLALTSKGAQERVVGYVMSLAPRTVVPTKSLLDMMRNDEVRSQVLVTASSPLSAELLARIADLTPVVIEALRKPLHESLARATVGGAAMYSDDPRSISELTENIIARLKDREKSREGQPMRRPYPKMQPRDISDFLVLSAQERTKRAESHGPLCLWDVSECTDLVSACGSDATVPTFSSDLYWDTSKCTRMETMFLNNTEFRGDLSTWDVSNVVAMDGMFQGSGISDSGIGNWDVGSLVHARSMFEGAPKLSPELNLSSWNVDSAIYLEKMFKGSAIRDGGIGKWRLNVDAITTDMFADTNFEGDLDDWPGLQTLLARIDVKATRGATVFGQGGQDRQARRPDALVAREFAKIARRRSAARREGACSIM